MNLELDIIFFSLAAFIALIALRAKNLLVAAIIMGIFSYFCALLYTSLGAVDVGFNEAVLGAGISSIFFITALFHFDELGGRRASPSLSNAAEAPALAVGTTIFRMLLLLVGGAVLFLGTRSLPVRSQTSPAMQHVAKYYLENAYKDTHTPNVVSSIIADYRAFDTLGETLVIFAAALACLSILFSARRLSQLVLPSQSPIVQVVVRLMVPFIQLFGLYVIFHGHYSPGGGFQGGALIGAALILQRLLLRSPPLHHSNPWIMKHALVGLSVFMGLGFWTLFSGQEFLNYASLPFAMEVASLRSIGILIAEIGIAFTVAACMLAIFDRLVRQPHTQGKAV